MTALSSDTGSYDVSVALRTNQSAPPQIPFSSNTAALDAPGSSVSQVARTHDASQVPLALEFVEMPFLSSGTTVLGSDDVVVWTNDARQSQNATTSRLSSDTATAEPLAPAVTCPSVQIETPFLSSDTVTLDSPRVSLSNLSGTTASQYTLGADVETTSLPSDTATLDVPGSSLSEYADRAWRASQYTLVEADRVRAASVPWSSSETLVPVRPGGSSW
ncbi:hypothetical protein DFH06DRAFT_1192481 [Mycena polygramma]|nr:hypothetical protein DFH06DRAFT_1192481 [Mycena polygramma]